MIDAGLPPPEPDIINFQPIAGAPGSTFLIQGRISWAQPSIINGIGAHFNFSPRTSSA